MGQSFTSLFSEKETHPIDADQLADLIVASSYCCAVTGAGASAESGIPTFRDPSDGIWQKYSVTDCGTIWGFKRHPDRLWRMLSEFIQDHDPKPNSTHLALAKLEQLGKLEYIVTQNVDRLHQDAGSRNVVEYHGSLMESICMKCKTLMTLNKKIVGTPAFRTSLPPKCSCGGTLKPNAVLFGEWIPSEASYAANREAKKCDLMLVIGTSGTVSPASSIPWTASNRGAKIVEINIRPTTLTNKVADYIFLQRGSKLLDVAHQVEAKIEKHKSVKQ